MRNDMVSYYAQRAREYERVYAKPERQADLRQLRGFIAGAFAGEDVLEISCGTGYWTEVMARTARSITACDISSEVLDIARGKDWQSAQVEFHQADSYDLPKFSRLFTGMFSGFWWSHVPKRRLGSFLEGAHSRLGSGARVVFVDNRYVEGSSTPIARRDSGGDSFQHRQLSDGSTHEVLKNFPTEEELLRSVAGFATMPAVTLTEYFWILSYRLN